MAFTWTALVALSACSAAVGAAVLGGAPQELGAALSAFTAGAVLAMLADTMVPDAYRQGGRFAGLATVAGFTFSFLVGQ
jgi:ZIP family zinc transporter